VNCTGESAWNWPRKITIDETIKIIFFSVVISVNTVIIVYKKDYALCFLVTSLQSSSLSPFKNNITLQILNKIGWFCFGNIRYMILLYMKIVFCFVVFIKALLSKESEVSNKHRFLRCYWKVMFSYFTKGIFFFKWKKYKHFILFLRKFIIL